MPADLYRTAHQVWFIRGLPAASIRLRQRHFIAIPPSIRPRKNQWCWCQRPDHFSVQGMPQIGNHVYATQIDCCRLRYSSLSIQFLLMDKSINLWTFRRPRSGRKWPGSDERCHQDKFIIDNLECDIITHFVQRKTFDSAIVEIDFAPKRESSSSDLNPLLASYPF